MSTDTPHTDSVAQWLDRWSHTPESLGNWVRIPGGAERMGFLL